MLPPNKPMQPTSAAAALAADGQRRWPDATLKKPTLKTRKPINDLVPADLVAFPIWEFAVDEEGAPNRDETWVRPVESRVLGV